MSATLARAFWIARPGRGEIREEPLPQAGPGEVLVRAEYSGISRGTESLVFNGHVPPSEYERMRAPFQQGQFPAPVKYGYASVGIVEGGERGLEGTPVFALFPHQTRYVISARALVPLPDSVPPARAVLAANLETALNGVWDAQLDARQRVTVVGAGTVGCLVAWTARHVVGCDVELIDINPRRKAIADRLGVAFRDPASASRDAHVVIHASGSPDALSSALRLAAFEATIVEMSWYGDRVVPLRLGEDFHSRRLTLKSSQVGTVALSHRSEWTTRRRLEHAIALLKDPVLDALITSESRFDELPDVMPRLTAPASDTLCHRIAYV